MLPAPQKAAARRAHRRHGRARCSLLRPSLLRGDLLKCLSCALIKAQIITALNAPPKRRGMELGARTGSSHPNGAATHRESFSTRPRPVPGNLQPPGKGKRPRAEPGRARSPCAGPLAPGTRRSRTALGRAAAALFARPCSGPERGAAAEPVPFTPLIL